MKKNTKWIAQTALMTALLIVLQFVTKAFGQFVTGSCVNLVLALSALICGLSSGITVALLSPFFAFLLGIGPAFLPIVPCVCVGNTVYVLLLSLLFGAYKGKKLPAKGALVLTSAAAKAAALYLLVVKIAVPALGLAEKQAAVISASFSWPQLVTGIIGGLIALVIYPRLKKGAK